ncbi:Alpha/Beta hydrolase protein [Baffinella frigidus]|nr:Alpha/Beta hydrolase protein [Cryptophyta sp. CCMP2293]
MLRRVARAAPSMIQLGTHARPARLLPALEHTRREFSSESKMPLNQAATSDPQRVWLQLANGRKLAITDEGDGSSGVVIAMHGSPGSVRDFRYLGAHLERAGVRVVRIDFPGHGSSEEAAIGEHGDPGDGQALAGLVDEVCSALRLDRPLLLGHSLGCQVAMNLAARSPDGFAGLVLLNPVPCLSAHKFIRPYALIWGFSKFHTWVDSTGLQSSWRAALVVLWKMWGWQGKVTASEVAIVHRRLLFVDFERQAERSHALKLSRIPCYVAWATNDGLIEAELSHQLSQSLPAGPRVVFAHGGHHIHKHHAGEIADGILEFLALNEMRASAAPRGETLDVP